MVNVKQMIEVIEAEARLTSGAYVEGALGGTPLACEQPGHCAMGALMVAVGVDDEDLRRLTEPCAFGLPLLRALHDAYGTDVGDYNAIIHANDSSGKLQFDAALEFAERKRVVIDRIRMMGMDSRIRNTPEWDRQRYEDEGGDDWPVGSS
jgi:hypothetical protein